MSGFSMDVISGQLPEALSVGAGAFGMLSIKEMLPFGAAEMPEWVLAPVGVAVACQLYRHFALGEDWFTYGGGYRTPMAMAGAVLGGMYPKISSPAVSSGIAAAVGDIVGKLYEDNFSS